MDRITKEQRSANMSRVRSAKTKPEQIVASFLRENHVGYRRNCKDLIGKPDFVLSKYHAVIFVNGCFWHGHNCKKATIPKTNTQWWTTKINNNKLRDERVYEQLKSLGWRVFVIWECELKKNEGLNLKIMLREILLDEVDAYI